eukprot:367758-Hanusia_phi.AAC.2
MYWMHVLNAEMYWIPRSWLVDNIKLPLKLKLESCGLRPGAQGLPSRRRALPGARWAPALSRGGIRAGEHARFEPLIVFEPSRNSEPSGSVFPDSN